VAAEENAKHGVKHGAAEKEGKNTGSSAFTLTSLRTLTYVSIL